MTLLRSLPFFFSSLLILQSCQKDKDEPVTNTECGTRLRMMSFHDEQSYDDDKYFRTLYYDGAGRLETFLDSTSFRSDNGVYVGTTSSLKRLQFDQDGRIIQITERDGPTDSVYELWFYNPENLIVKDIIVSQLEKDTFIHTFSYDDQKRLVIDSGFYNKNKGMIDYTTFRYDTSDNIVEWDHYTNVSGAVQQDLKAEAIYDDHPNPRHLIALYSIPYEGDHTGLSRNNLVRITYTTTTVTQYEYQYQYCTNGWPRWAAITIAPSQVKVGRYDYEYD